MIPLLAVLAVAYAHPDQLVDTDWVAAHARDANVRIVDMRRGGYDAGHIPGAVYLQPDSIRDAKNAPTFLPTAAAFESLMVRLGISNTTRVVVYDERGGIYAARLWWLLNAFGHTNVALLNGGWIKWTAEQRQNATATPTLPPVKFQADQPFVFVIRDNRSYAGVLSLDQRLYQVGQALALPLLESGAVALSMIG